MHFRLFVTFNKEEAETSEEARDYVYDMLGDDASFVGGGGRFNSPIADWFVIGGRWSGELSRETFMKDVKEKIEKLEKKKDISIWGTHYGDEKKQKAQAELKEQVEKMYQEALPKEYQGKGLLYDRDTYNDRGYEDDAMVVNKEIYDTLLKQHEGENNEDGAYYDDASWGRGYLSMVDLDYDLVSEDFIGKKWIVVVDYHS